MHHTSGEAKLRIKSALLGEIEKSYVLTLGLKFNNKIHDHKRFGHLART